MIISENRYPLFRIMLYAAFTEPHPASRMANPLLEWRPYAKNTIGAASIAVERESSPNRTVARFDSPAKS
jgi:hypothetical protein